MPRTGPKTTAGKAVSSLNRLTHGLRAANLVIEGVESEKAWRTFHNAVLEDIGAEGPIESALASRVAELIWRLRRVARAEQQFVRIVQARNLYTGMDEERRRMQNAETAAGISPEKLQETLASPYFGSMMVSAATDAFARSLPVLLPDGASLDKLMRYEAHLNRQLSRALHQLAVMLRRRLGAEGAPAVSLGGLLET